MILSQLKHVSFIFIGAANLHYINEINEKLIRLKSDQIVKKNRVITK